MDKYEGFGHPGFYELLEEEAKLHSLKNHDFAKGGDVFGNFLRVSNILANYPGLDLKIPSTIAIIYMFKQLDATLWMLSNKHEPKVEGHKERWKDVSVYSNIIILLLERERERERLTNERKVTSAEIKEAERKQATRTKESEEEEISAFGATQS